MKKIFTLIILCLNLSLSAQIINDESYLDESFLKFKNELYNCILKKDTTKLKGLLAERVFESNYGCTKCTPDQLIKYSFSEGALDASWISMQKIVRFGFIRTIDKYPNRIVPHNKTIFSGPSYRRKIDDDNELLILGENVNIREKPSLKSKIIKTSSFEKFKCDCNISSMKETTYQFNDGINWIEIKLKNNKIGYVSEKLTSKYIIKEMTIAKIKGKWKIISWFQGPGC